MEARKNTCAVAGIDDKQVSVNCLLGGQRRRGSLGPGPRCARFPDGITARFPDLTIACLEAGAGWAPYFLQRMNEEWEKRGHVSVSTNIDGLGPTSGRPR